MLTLLLTLSLPGQIEFKPGVARIPFIVAQLAEKSGQKLRSSLNLQNDVVGVIAPRASKEEIMAQLAGIVDGEWVTQGDEKILIRTEATEKRQAAESRQRLIKRIQEGLDKLPGDYLPEGPEQQKAIAEFKRLNSLMDPQNFDAAVWRKREAASNSAPLMRFMYKTLKKIGASQLTEKNAWGRLVFTLNPNRLQKKLPITPIELETLSKRQMQFSDEVGEIDNSMQIYSPVSKLKSPITNVVMSVKQNSILTNGSLTCKMSIVDAKGRILTNLTHSFSSFLAEGPPTVLPAGKDKVIELDKPSKLLLALAKNMENGPVSGAVPSELTGFFMRPDANEPTALITNEILREVAAASQKNVIASLDDIQFFLLAYSSADGKPTVRRFESALNQTDGVRDEKDGWIRYRPLDPTQTRTVRVDRVMLADHFRRVEKGTSRLESFAEMALKHRELLEDTSYPIFFLLLGQEPPGSYGSSLNTMRLFGLLSPEQKKLAATERRLNLTPRDLTRDQYKIVEAIAYGEENVMSHAPVEQSDADAQDGYVANLIEPTSLFPNGLTDPFLIMVGATDKPSWFGLHRYGSRPADPNSMAWELIQMERQDLFPYAASMDIQNTKYAQGHMRQWDFSFTLTPSGAINQQLTDNTIPTGAGKPYRDLPEDLKTEVQKALAQLREAYKNTKPGELGLGGRKNPPPRANRK